MGFESGVTIELYTILSKHEGISSKVTFWYYSQNIDPTKIWLPVAAPPSVETPGKKSRFSTTPRIFDPTQIWLPVGRSSLCWNTGHRVRYAQLESIFLARDKKKSKLIIR